MRTLFSLDYQDAHVPDSFINRTGDRLKLLSFDLFSQQSKYSFFSGVDDVWCQLDAAFIKVKEIKPSLMVVIGIGGSLLGFQAIAEALLGRAYNETNPPLRYLCADTFDAAQMHQLLAITQAELDCFKAVLLVVISKSGKTTETLVNAACFFDLLKKYKGAQAQDYVVVVTDASSPLAAIARQNNFLLMSIPAQLGGRFSVFSVVGLFPLMVLGIDIVALLQGVALVNNHVAESACNYSLLSATLLYYHYLQGLSIHDTFIFSSDLVSFGAWYRQLLAESLGKRCDRGGNVVEVGLTPSISIGTNDLHSIAQLHLAGPRDKSTTFISFEKCFRDRSIPEGPFSQDSCINSAFSLSRLHNATMLGTKQAYRINGRPFISLQAKELSAVSLAALMQYKMVEVVYLAELLDVNPFDQPEVELYKVQTRAILGLH